MRLTHWGVAAAVVLNGLVTDEGSELHVYVGYAAFTFLALRLVWGLIGPEEARFAAFPPSLTRAVEHVRDMAAGRHRTYRSHNPLGTLNVYVIWATLAVVTVTGIAMAGAPFAFREEASAVPRGADVVMLGSADEFGEHEEEEEHGEGFFGERGEALEEVHEAAANVLFVLAALHVGGVAFESARSGSGLVRAMVTGRGRQERGS